MGELWRGGMEAHAAAAVATVGLTVNNVISLLKMIKARYSVKTSEGKNAFPHPYRPWEVPEGTLEAGAEKAYLAYKAYENSKEWTQLMLPLVWVLSLSGEAVPYATQTGVQLLTLGLKAHAGLRHPDDILPGTPHRIWSVRCLSRPAGHGRGAAGLTRAPGTRLPSLRQDLHGCTCLGCIIIRVHYY